LKNSNSKEQLISAVIKLLSESEEPANITARQIAAEAGTNLAMINYYFKSKDELLNVAIGKIIENSAEKFRTPAADIPPKEQLREMLVFLGSQVMKYSGYTKISIPYILLQDEIKGPLYILPYLKAYFGERKSELECRIIAYEMLSFMQLAFFRSDAFYRYTGVDLTNEKTCNELVDMQLNLFLGDTKGDYTIEFNRIHGKCD
jgi:AcrR family transcriptional regulator